MAKTKKVTSNELEPPFPACPGRPPKYGFYIYKEGKNKTPVSRGYFNFYAKYAAKHFLEILLDSKEYKWVDQVGGLLKGSGETIIDSTGIIVDGYGLEEVLDYEYKNEAERNWQLPYGCDVVQLRAFKLISEEKKEALKSNPNKTSFSAEDTPKKVKRERKPKVDKTGLVAVKDIAEELGCKPGDARAALRKGKVEKPEAGWCWPQDEVESIKKLIKKGLK